MNVLRRDFLRLGAGALLAGELPKTAGAMRAPLKPLAVKETEIAVGAARPFGALQVSDTHIARADRRDDERKITLAANRNFAPWGAYYLDQTVARARARGELLLHTGDLIDFVSAANLDQAEGRFAGNDWIVSAGNHEFSRYVGEAKEDEAYKRENFARVQASYPNDLSFASRVVNGVNFVSLDNVYYYVTEAQRARFEAEVKKGLPIVLLCHVPFYGPKLYDFVMAHTKNKCAYVMSAPDELVDTYEKGKTYPAGEEWRHRAVQQRADAVTKDFTRWLKEQKLLKAILCGHLHHFFEERFSPTAMQYVCSATFKGEARAIRFV